MVDILIVSGYGINCEEETAFAFQLAGGNPEIVHINDIIDGFKNIKDYQILVLPGGFSYGDDTGSGNALASRIRNHLEDKLRRFILDDKLMIGICNGFQVMVNLGLLPANKGYGKRTVALISNDMPLFINRWVDLEFKHNSPWTTALDKISLPIAHAEGKLFCTKNTLNKIIKHKLIAAQYIYGSICKWQNLKYNPNGSINDIASLTDKSGRLIGMMPHPERAIRYTQYPFWNFIKEKNKSIPTEGPGLKIFQNAIEYFSI